MSHIDLLPVFAVESYSVLLLVGEVVLTGGWCTLSVDAPGFAGPYSDIIDGTHLLSIVSISNSLHAVVRNGLRHLCTPPLPMRCRRCSVVPLPLVAVDLLACCCLGGP